MEQFRTRLMALAFLCPCIACLDDGQLETACTSVGFTAVRVQIIGSQTATTVTETHAGKTQQCIPEFPQLGSQDAGVKGVNPDYDCIEMGGGEYSITVHASEQRWTGRVQVKADECHVTEPSTITIDLSTKPAGSAELAHCTDGSGRNDCCIKETPEGACHTPMLYCRSSCDFASPEAKRGEQNTYSCLAGHWTSNGPSQCIRPGVRKDEL